MDAKHGYQGVGYVMCDDCIGSGNIVEDIRRGGFRYWEGDSWAFRE